MIYPLHDYLIVQRTAHLDDLENVEQHALVDDLAYFELKDAMQKTDHCSPNNLHRDDTLDC